MVWGNRFGGDGERGQAGGEGGGAGQQAGIVVKVKPNQPTLQLCKYQTQAYSSDKMGTPIIDPFGSPLYNR